MVVTTGLLWSSHQASRYSNNRYEPLASSIMLPRFATADRQSCECSREQLLGSTWVRFVVVFILFASFLKSRGGHAASDWLLGSERKGPDHQKQLATDVRYCTGNEVVDAFDNASVVSDTIGDAITAGVSHGATRFSVAAQANAQISMPSLSTTAGSDKRVRRTQFSPQHQLNRSASTYGCHSSDYDIERSQRISEVSKTCCPFGMSTFLLYLTDQNNKPVASRSPISYSIWLSHSTHAPCSNVE